jgi:hypothetical protein
LVRHLLWPEDRQPPLPQLYRRKIVAICSGFGAAPIPAQVAGRQQFQPVRISDSAFRLDDMPDDGIALRDTSCAIGHSIPSTSIME